MSLIEVLKDDDAGVRRSAAEALGKIGPEATPAVEALTTALQDPVVDVRVKAAEALGQISPEAAPAIEVLMEALQGEDADGRLDAARVMLSLLQSQYDKGETEQLIHFERAYTIIFDDGSLSEDDIISFERVLSGLRDRERLDQGRLFNIVKAWVKEHLLISLFVLFYAILLTLWSLLLWQRPFWLLKVNDRGAKRGTFEPSKARSRGPREAPKSR